MAKASKKGDVVRITCYEEAKPLYRALRLAVIKAGGHVLGNYLPSADGTLEKDYFQHASDEQLDFFPKKYMRGLVDEIDHQIVIISETNKQAMKGVDPQKIMRTRAAFKPYMDWRRIKENQGKFTWTLALYGTEAMAAETGMTLKEYWQEIINGCFLNTKDPVLKWREVFASLAHYQKKLNTLAKKIAWYHIEGPDADLWIQAGDKRAWMGGSGRNIPSYELFTSPDWRGTHGWIRFNQPLYQYGVIIEGVELHFKDGVVTKATARKNEKTLLSMIASKNADKIGEFSMTDKRFSRITRFMAETLYDENVGGEHGNTHIALGSAYHDCYAGNPAKVSKKEWEKLGYNDSPIHTDIVSTTPRTITAHFHNGKTQVIYKDGMYQV
ncbi:MAG: aminopeptidase [Candidatus Pacebacteria bacterium]|nr:aminopeptidase [Candidatus Paceibacterota bacterium]